MIVSAGESLSTLISVAEPSIADDPQISRRGITREQYDVLIDAGLLEGQRIELLEGVLVEMAPQGEQHVDTVLLLNRWLTRHLPEPWIVGPRTPLVVSHYSEPEPDISVVQRRRGEKPRDAQLVIEVAVSSQRTDLLYKPRLYARAGVPQYWVIDLPSREVVVHSEPVGDAYGTIKRLPWTTPLSVLDVDVDLATILADL